MTPWRKCRTRPDSEKSPRFFTPDATALFSQKRWHFRFLLPLDHAFPITTVIRIIPHAPVTRSRCPWYLWEQTTSYLFPAGMLCAMMTMFSGLHSNQFHPLEGLMGLIRHLIH
jgi:hypothetical protein